LRKSSPRITHPRPAALAPTTLAKLCGAALQVVGYQIFVHELFAVANKLLTLMTMRLALAWP
jgi:hypothetical protein